MQVAFSWEPTSAGTQYLLMGDVRVGYIAPRRGNSLTDTWAVVCFLAESRDVKPVRGQEQAKAALQEECFAWLRKAGVMQQPAAQRYFKHGVATRDKAAVREPVLASAVSHALTVLITGTFGDGTAAPLSPAFRLEIIRILQEGLEKAGEAL